MKKWISLLMALLMALSLLSATAVAAEPSEPVQPEVLQSEEPVQEEVSQKEEEQLPELMLAEPETEENAPTVLSASDDLDTRLSNAGFTAPQMGSMNGDHKDFYLRTPWQDNDCVSFDYDNSGIVGRLTVTLKPATLAKWKALYEAEKQQDFGFDDSLDVNIRSDAPVSTVRGAGALIWEAGCTNTVQNFLDGNLDDYMEPYRVSGGYDSFGRYVPLISVEKRNGKIILSAQEGETYYRYLMVWDNDNDDSSRLAQYNLFVTVKVEGDIYCEWDTHPIEERLADAGFVAPQWDKNHDGIPGALDLTMPAGLKEGVDYTCGYNAQTGELNIAINAGTAADWKSAYLDSLINGCADRIIAAIRFRSENNAVRACSWLGGEDDLETLLRDGAWASGDVYDVDGSMYVGNGAYLAGVWNNSGDTVTISRGNGALTSYRAALWRDANGVETRYLVKVTITCTAFSHTVKAPVTDTLNAVDTARFTLDLTDPGLWMTSILSDGKVTLVPNDASALTGMWSAVGGFWVKAPAGYTLQSCFIAYDQYQNSQINVDSTGAGGYWIPVDFRDIASDPHTAFTLGWKNDNDSEADLVESLDVYIDSNWGKLSNHEGAPNALDVAAIYDCLTQDITPACGDRMACDVNMDGYVDVYDLQYLYECVAQVQ